MNAEAEQTSTVAPRTPAKGNRRRRRAEVLGVLLIIAAGVAIRSLHLDAVPFWADEAESSINALTILQHGYPMDSYLGMPIYENTNVWFWPENQEYEFRDVSYSTNGFAVYHGWLPLYAIAASFAVHGIEPDRDDGTRLTKHDVSEQKRRTRAARLPAVLFGALFLLAVFLGGKILYGRDAGWAALIIGSITPYHLQISDQARYYSAQVTLTTACCVLLWLVIQKCRWKDICLAGTVFVLLFHTHLLSFFTAAVMAGLTTPVVIYRHKDWFKKMFLFAAIVAAGTLPWIIVTGFYSHQSGIPRAWPLLQIPSDLLRYRPFNPLYALSGLVILLFALWDHVSFQNVRRERSPTVRLAPVLLFLGGWALVGYVTFLLCMPAVSFTKDRLNLSYWGPLFLLGAIMSATLARIVAPRLSRELSAVLAAALMLLIFFVTGHSLNFGGHSGHEKWELYKDVFKQLDAMRLDWAAKLYAAPNSHLVFSFYSGLPVQDITPVRKSYLDSYRGDIVYIDVGVTLTTNSLDPERIRETARESGQNLSSADAEEVYMLLLTRPYREAILQAVDPGRLLNLEPIPAFARAALGAHRAEVASMFVDFEYELVSRGFEVRDWSDWCAVLKYRFVHPETRRGVHANYVDRLKGADAMIIARTEPVVIYRSRWHPPDSTEPLTFRFLR